MKHLKLVVLLLLFVSQLQYAQYTDDINSNRPGKSMMAYSIGKTVIQVETGLNFQNEDHSKLKYNANGFVGELDMRWGLFFEQLEFNVDLLYQNDNYETIFSTTNRSALRETIIGAKYLIYDPYKNYEEKDNLYSWKANHEFKWRQLIPAVSAYAGVHLNFTDNPFNFAPLVDESVISPKAMVITQNNFGLRWVLVTNLMYDKIGSDLASINYIITLTRGFNRRWSGFVENQGYNGDYYSDGIFRLGAAYLITSDMQVDISIGKNIKDTPALFNAGAGFSWRFDANYKEVKLEQEDGSKTENKMKKRQDKLKKKKEEEFEKMMKDKE